MPSDDEQCSFRTSDGREVRADVGGRCPFCGGRWWANAEHFAVIHSLPPCERWNRTDPADYLAAVRKENN